MSTMDYLEFKEHIEHAFTQKDKAEYYKRQNLGAINKKANAVIAELNEYIQTCKKIADKKQGLADNANKIINSPAGSYAKSETQNPAKRFSGQKFDSPREDASNYAGDAKYWRRQYELALAIKKEILADPTKASKGTRIGQLGIPESAVSHSNLEHAFNPKDRAQEYMQKDLDSRAGTVASSLVRYATKYLEAEKQVANRISELNKNLGKSPQSDAAIKAEIQREKNKLLQYAKSTQTAIVNTDIRNFGSFSDRGRGKFNERVAWSNKLPNAIEPALRDIRYSDLSDLGKFGRSLQTLVSLLNNVSHSSLEHASIAGVPSRLRSKMQDAIYKKTGYQSKGSYAGAPVNAKQATTDQNKAAANARFSASIKSAIEACNRDAAEAQSVYVEATTRINNIVSRSRGEVNSIIRSVNEYNENVRNIRNQTITKKSTFSAVANGKLYQGVRDEQVPVDANRQFISFSAGAQKISANKYVYKPKMLLIDSDPGTYKEV